MTKDHFDKENFATACSVSHETLEKLSIYHDLLIKWQKAINLVSPSTLDQAWQRHFQDSAQISSLIPTDIKTLVDLGSGAGFPGMVLAILCPHMDVHLIESDMRKCQFLRTVSRETETPVSIHNTRIENALNLKPDIITARALADLKTLFDYVLPWAQNNPALEMLFLKGARADEEIHEAQNHYNFSSESIKSVSDPQGRILHIKALACG